MKKSQRIGALKKIKKSKINRVVLFLVICFFNFATPASAEITLMANDNFSFKLIPYFRTDVVTLKNNLSLDSKNKDDSSIYAGIDYSLGFDLQFENSGPQAYLKLERNGPFDYDAPLFVHNTLITSTAAVERYRNSELLPHIEEFWYDFGLFKLPARLKSGLFIYEVGNNLSTPSLYENFSFQLYGEKEKLKWQFYYCRPDLVNKSFLGPRIQQEREQGIHYTTNKANFFAADALFDFGQNSLQPYIEILSDRSGNRANLFTTPTHKDLLGTFGLAWDLSLDELSVGIEAARNFGKAKSSDSNFQDVEHCGYLIYADISYEFERITPRSSFLLASGNKVTTDMVENGETEMTSSKNRAFSAYSPFNTNFANSIYPGFDKMPLVAMGNGWGLNYGINRPTTFGDPGLLENLILFNFGTDYKMTDKLSFSFDWWYLKAMEKGIGLLGDAAKELPRDLGNELNLSANYEINENVTVSLLGGYFFPGKYYKETRDDTEGGSLFNPCVRGDGKANGAYQIELSVTFAY
ncbi:MAG: hypothetical protein PHQ96_02715 [Candidatus Omnitrophica bacterium]|nr:hypothetical protein [Candidatus Omnitrophota bacterium]